MFAYCKNNPVNMEDDDGTRPMPINGDQSPEITQVSCEIMSHTYNTGSASNRLVSFLKKYERYEPRPYRGQDSQNRTIGYGHVIQHSEIVKISLH